MFVSQLMRQIHLVKTLVKIYGKVQIIISSSVVDSIFSLDLIVNFEKDVCEAANNVISYLLLTCPLQYPC